MIQLPVFFDLYGLIQSSGTHVAKYEAGDGPGHNKH